jgi:hypothetical protein
VIVADAGYWHHGQMEQIAAQGIPVLIPPDADKRKGIRPGWDGGPYAFMRRVLETELGKALYRRRQELVEPMFANTKFNRGFTRFARRGRAACRSEWRLVALTHNPVKLHSALQAPERPQTTQTEPASQGYPGAVASSSKPVTQQRAVPCRLGGYL